MKRSRIDDGKRKTKIQENLFAISILGLFFVQFLVFWLYANFNSIKLAFMQYTGNDNFVFLPANNLFKNFLDFFKDVFSNTGSRYVLNGAYFHVLSSFLCLPISYMFAFAIYKKLPASGFFKVVLYLPAILSSMVTILLFLNFIEGGLGSLTGGFVKKVLGKSFPYVFSDPKYNLLMMSIYVIFFGMPGSLLVNLGSMSRVPNELIEYGELEGISLWKEFILITIPMIFPVLQVQCLGLFTGFFTAQGPLFVFYDNNAPENIRTFGYYIFVQIARNKDGTEASKYMYGYSAASSLAIGLFSIPIVQLTKKLFDKLDPGAEF